MNWYLLSVDRYLVPLEAAALVIWFVYDNIHADPKNWYKLGNESLMMCILQVHSLIALSSAEAFFCARSLEERKSARIVPAPRA